VRRLVGDLHDLIAAGKSAAVHCRAGIGRSGLIAASILKTFGLEVSQAFALIAATRGVAVPDTTEQHDWVLRFERL